MYCAVGVARPIRSVIPQRVAISASGTDPVTTGSFSTESRSYNLGVELGSDDWMEFLPRNDRERDPGMPLLGVNHQCFGSYVRRENEQSGSDENLDHLVSVYIG